MLIMLNRPSSPWLCIDQWPRRLVRGIWNCCAAYSNELCGGAVVQLRGNIGDRFWAHVSHIYRTFGQL